MDDSVSSNESVVAEVVPVTASKKNTSNDVVKAIISHILVQSTNVDGVMVPAHGAIISAARKFGVSKQTASRIFIRAKNNFHDENIQAYTASPKKKGRKKGTHQKWCRHEVAEAIAQLPYYKRKTMQSISSALSIPKTSVHRMYQCDKIIRHHKNFIKPTLTEHNKMTRFLYCFDKITEVRDNSLYYNSSYFNVHVDEKWFFITEKQQSTYLVEGEEGPERSVQNKQHITKVMFLCAVARPRFGDTGNCTFDGKIGMWPIISREPARRNSANRPRGTIVTRPLNVTYDVYLDYFINKVIPAIKRRFPRNHYRNLTINIQHDNAPVHFHEQDPTWRELVEAETLYDFRLSEQPANSPDTNVLDLGFFASIQSIQWSQEPAYTIDGLILNVMLAWQKYEAKTLDRIWLSHQACMNEIIQAYGGNHYKIPHLSKNTLLDERGVLPSSIAVSDEAEQALIKMGFSPDDIPGYEMEENLL
jgi:hypothetical protein